MKHKHEWVVKSYCGGMTDYACAECGAAKTSQTTKKQAQELERNDKRIEQTHALYHLLLAKYFDESTNKWKKKGWEFIQIMEKWAKKYPKDIFNAGVDDNYHAGSDIFFIRHGTKRSHMGYTALYIPQCTGEDPIAFFLYPGDHENLIKVLTKIWKAGK